MNNYIQILGIITIILTLFACTLIAPNISKSLMYSPYKGTKEEFKKISNKFKRNEEFINFMASDDTKLTGMLINYHKPANWNDIIFLYSHGNGSWIGGLFDLPQIDMLSNFGSIFAYDYRQYGLSEGFVDEKGTYCDIIGAWKYLTQIKKVSPNKIIVYGHSMGGAVSTKLISILINKKQKLPLGLILDSTFSSVLDMGNHIMPGCGWIANYTYDNIKNLQQIDGIIPILVMHSPNDETVPYSQSIKIKENCKCTYVIINGSHNAPVFNDETLKFIRGLL